MYTKVEHGGGENQWGSHALLKKLLVMHSAIGSKQFCFFHGSIPQLFFLRRGIPRAKVLFWCDGGTTGGADEVDVIISFAVMVDVRQTAEIARDANWPVQRGGLQLDFVNDFIDKL